MSNVLSEEKRLHVIALGRLGRSLRRIEQATGVRRETPSAYRKAAGIAARASGASGRQVSAKPAIHVTTGFGVEFSEVAIRKSPARKVTTGSKPESAAANRNINPENLPFKRQSNKEDSKPAIQSN